MSYSRRAFIKDKNFCCNDAFPLLHSPLRVLMLASFCAAL